jgi:hypothetical protein
MNTIIKPENIRIYRKSDGTYTIRPEGKYVPWLSHFDRLTSLTISVYPSGAEARKEIQSTWRVGLPEKLPAYLAFELNGLPKNEFIPGLDRMTITVEDLIYLGFHLGTVGIIGINSSQREQEKITYEDFMPKTIPPIHHQVLSALDNFCKNVGNSAQSEDYRDSFGHFYTRFWWHGNGVEVTLSTVRINDEERRGHGLLTEIIDYLKLDSRVTQIRVESVHSARFKEHLKRSGFKESAPTYFILSRNESWV